MSFPEGLTIRLLRAEDSFEELTALLHRSYRVLADMGMRYMATHQSPEVTRERCEEGECYVAILGLKIVGTITFRDAGRCEGCDWYDLPYVSSFGQFAVDPALQNRGLGGTLVDICEQRALETGALELALDTAENAKHLIEYYEKRGYRKVSETQWREANYRSVILSKAIQSRTR